MAARVAGRRSIKARHANLRARAREVAKQARAKTMAAPSTAMHARSPTSRSVAAVGTYAAGASEVSHVAATAGKQEWSNRSVIAGSRSSR